LEKSAHGRHKRVNPLREFTAGLARLFGHIVEARVEILGDAV
jgi:hypothetical protein